MEVILAETAGFCMGVRRAVDLVLEVSKHPSKRIVTYGPLIHNPQVLELLQHKGIHAIDSPAQAQGGNASLELVRVTSRGRSVIDSATLTTLEDDKPHVLAWTRGRDGTMTVSVDNNRLMSVRDASFRDPFDALTLTNTGTDIIVQNVEVLGAR